MHPTLLIVPGWLNSGPQHWQSLWERTYRNARRVEQQDWAAPRREAWVRELDTAVSNAIAPVALIAHSLGCITVAHWTASASSQQLAKIHSAMLVAPADVERPDCIPELRNFAPMPKDRLPFATLLIASSNDPYCALPRARSFAECWGSGFRDIGDAGHVNAESGFGEWPEGESLLLSLTNPTLNCKL